MKIYTIITIILSSIVFLGCTKDGETELQKSSTFLFQEDFSDIKAVDPLLNTTGWTNIAEIGTKKWTEGFFGGNGYAEFSPFQSGQAVNIGWLISPAIDMDTQDNEKLLFQSAHNFLSSRDNTIELMVSTDFNGSNFTSSNWKFVPSKVVTPDIKRFTFIDSGLVDLSKYKGKIHFAFRVKGGTAGAIDATFQIDNIKIIY